MFDYLLNTIVDENDGTLVRLFFGACNPACTSKVSVRKPFFVYIGKVLDYFYVRPRYN